MAWSTGTLYCAVSDPGRLYVLPTGASAPTLLASGSFDAARIAVDQSFVYLADELGSRVARVPLTGGAVETVLLLDVAPFDVRTDSGDVWTATSEPGELWHGAAPTAELWAGLLRPRTDIALDAKYVYWSSPGTGILRLPR